jgi:hypothetical protein
MARAISNTAAVNALFIRVYPFLIPLTDPIFRLTDCGSGSEAAAID